MDDPRGHQMESKSEIEWVIADGVRTGGNKNNKRIPTAKKWPPGGQNVQNEKLFSIYDKTIYCK